MAPQDPALTLTAAERQRLQAFSGSLATRLVALVDSHRPDWGFPLLIGMARLQALDESLASGRLVVLDAFPPGASTIAPALGGDRRAFIDELHDEARRGWWATRTRVFAAAAYDEALAIQSSGFRDRPVPGDGGSGVWVSERPPAGEGGDSWVVFAIDVPEDAASAYARGDGPEGRQYLMPAELLNRSGPPVAQDQWSE